MMEIVNPHDHFFKEILSRQGEARDFVLYYLPAEVVRRAIEAVVPEEGGVTMPTLAEKWIQQGREQGLQQGLQQGLLAGLELSLELKFGSEGIRILPEIYKIEDVNLLRAISEGLKTAHSIEELRQIYQ
ncbi:MAG: Rpn family recombination-promoting nuclease/putative transposase [Candidatus Latescibacteria bacterium]|nr:Rpn family recombination-promoting nuclease/putative transposase [Candidatus Latescibacterota bacterium]